MKAIIRIFAAAAVMLAMAGAANAQTYYFVEKEIPINWKPETPRNRYTVAVNPVLIASAGLRVDFEMELRKPGNWLQFGVMGYLRPAYKNWDNEVVPNYWFSMNSGYDDFTRMSGFGVALGYKYFMGKRGWYCNPALLFNYYSVDYHESRYVRFTEDGVEKYRHEWGEVNTKFSKPTLQVNFGKHMAISRQVFLDIYVGLSYSHSFRSSSYNESRSYYYYDLFTDINGFARRGFEPSGGVRFGFVWGK